MTRATWAQIDLRAIRSNVHRLVERAAPAQLLAVVKADGYGHGALEVGPAALEAGAAWLGVALVEEGVALRDAGVVAPILLLSEPTPDSMPAAVAHGLTPTVCTHAGIRALAASGSTISVHLKVDTGMHRIGCRPDQAAELASAIDRAPSLELQGVWTHCAVADELASSGTEQQLTRFRGATDAIRARGIRWSITHAANSAALFAQPATHFDLVRCGIAIYGVPPAPELDGSFVAPVLSLVSHVSAVREIPAGDSVSYGWRWSADLPTRIATVPIGYADGVPRRLGLQGGTVLVRGRERPVVGVVTMDQLMIDIGEDPVEFGEEVVLLGRQGDGSITAWDWARRVDTIAYEILTGISARVPRRYTR